MITTSYENTYVSVMKARWDVIDLDLVIEVLSKASEPMTCHDIGFAIWGVGYLDNRRRSAHMGQMLKHLWEGGFIHKDEIKGEPIEVEYEKYSSVDEEGNTRYITVHDDAGNKYQMPNPNYSGYSHGCWVKVKKIITPTTKVYSLA